MSDKMREALEWIADEMRSELTDDGASLPQWLVKSWLTRCTEALAEQPAKGEAVVVMETCGDCDPCIGGRPDQCAVGGYPVLLEPPVANTADDEAEYLLNLCRANPMMGNKEIITEMREVFDAPPAPAVPDDTARLNWLEGREASLVTHREAIDEGEFAIWWTVTGEIRKIRSNSISGHPLGSVRSAIDAAMLASAPEVKP